MRYTKMTIGEGVWHTKSMRKMFTLPLFIGLLFLSNAFALNAQALSVIPSENENLYGMTTPAGSGRHLPTPSTNICKVTNLRDSGAGSLRDCLETPAPRTIIFEVSGTIHLKSNLSVLEYTTIAGQTAPSPGITLRGWALGVRDNTLVQHIRIRVGDHPRGYPYVERDTASTQGNNIVFDHNSLSWSIDELVNGSASDITYSNNIFSEALHSPLHPKGGHSRGLLVTGSYGEDNAQNVAVIGNLFAHNMTRNPVFAGKASGIVVNNINYNVNVAPKCDDHGLVQTCSVYNNVLKGSGGFVARADNDATQIYYGEHIINGQLVTYPETWDYTSTPFGRGVPEANRASTSPITIPDFTPKPTNEVWDWVLLNAGARPVDRDAVDARIVQEAQNGTGEVIVSQTEVGGWPELDENIRLLTPPANADEMQPSGYTALEEWLHDFSDYVEGEGDVLPIGVGETTLSPTPTPSALVWTVPGSVFEGQILTLSWEGVNTDSCTGTNFSTDGASSGSLAVSPEETVTYGLSCVGPGGTATDEFEVEVIPTPESQEKVLHFDFEEGSGGTTYDSSGRGYSGTIDGATWTTEGRTGNGLDFDGVDDIVNTDFPLGELSQFTATLWVKPDAFDDHEGVLSMHGIIMHHNLGQWEMKVGGKEGEVCKMQFGELPDVGVWNFIALAYDGEDCRAYYKENYRTASAEDWKSLRSTHLRIGRGNSAYGDSWFDGAIDDVRFYNYALNESELEQVKGGVDPDPRPPIVNIFAAPESISKGETSTLTWTTTEADSCTGTGFDAQGAVSGSVTVSPTKTALYSLACTGPNGTTQTERVVHVYDAGEAQDLLLRYAFDERSGTIAYDASGKEKHMSVKTVERTIGRSGYGLIFDGIEDSVKAPFNPEGLGEFTLTTWIKPSTSLDHREGILQSYGGILWHNYGGNWTMSYYGVNGTICSIKPGTLPEVNEWNFMALSYDGDVCNVHYLDTFSTHNATDGQELQEGNLLIGRGNPAYGDSWFDGVIDDVRVYNYALNQAEMEAVRDSGTYSIFHADFDIDNDIDIFDYNTLLTNFGSTSDCGNQADANEDCSVNIFDYNILLGEFGMSV